jgi:hypothetical protein
MPIHYAEKPKEVQLPKLKMLNKNERTYYIVDFSKVTKIEEIVTIIASMGVLISDDNPLYSKLEHLIMKDNPISESELNQK